MPNWLLVDADDADEARMVEVFEKRKNDLPMIPSPPERETPAGDDKPKIDKLDTYRLPARTEARRRDVLDVLRIYDDELGVGVVPPMHYVHVAGTGDGRACSATEPYPADQATLARTGAGQVRGEGVKVVMIDTGWMKASGPTTRQLPPYAGHGLFAEAVLKSRAPRARIRRLEFPISSGGAVKETDLADLLTQALAMKPQVISMSAGATRGTTVH